jgi:hypothetical protein
MMETVDNEIQWAGVRFLALFHHDARLVRLPGLFAFVHRGVGDDRTLLFVDHADCIARAAIPSHAIWSEARWHGMNEVHICLTACERLDRLQLKAHLLRRLQPPLNRMADENVGDNARAAVVRRAAG